MKKFIIKNIIVIGLIIFMYSCKELDQPIVLDPSQEVLFDTSYISNATISSVAKNVLIEEMSGVRCPNCPRGNAKTKEIYSNNPQRVSVVTVHSKSLASPYPGDLDLRSEDADELVALLGTGAKPSTYINRTIFSGNTQILIAGDPSNMDLWEGFVQSELDKTVPINMNLELVFEDLEKRKFRYRVTLEFSEALENINLGFLLTESDIVTQQVDGVVHLEEYDHEFVLRDFITSVLGEKLTENIVANTIIVKEFEIDLDDIKNPRTDGKYTNPEDWKMENMELVAFIRAENDAIIQSAKIEL